MNKALLEQTGQQQWRAARVSAELMGPVYCLILPAAGGSLSRRRLSSRCCRCCEEKGGRKKECAQFGETRKRMTSTNGTSAGKG